jgi:hypothetical protein
MDALLEVVGSRSEGLSPPSLVDIAFDGEVIDRLGWDHQVF